jgi:SAM-dependent methyltransferase
VEIIKRRGRREHDAEVIGEIRRWQSYRSANTRFPDARAAELGEMCRLAGVSAGETVAEIGAGSGALTYRLASAAGTGGRLFTYDVSRDNLVSVMLSNDKGLPIIPVAQSVADGGVAFPNEGTVDCVATLATFHHFDSRALRSGTQGREAAAAALNRLLRRGGRLVIGDVAHGTAAQRYFDAIDDPRYCHPNGYPHDFLTESSMRELVRAAGFDEVVASVREVPWVFASKADAIEFLSVMHNAQCPLDEVRAIAERHLRFEESSDRCVLRWELLFLQARKL